MPAAAQPVVDLRSDTVTRPTPAMRSAMAGADVGDDVYGEDPTVNSLQARAAEIFEREAALFFPSGSMANLTAIKIWTRPGSEVICESQAHIYLYEMASIAAIAGCMPNTISAPGGILRWELIEPAIRPHIYYRAQTALIEVENTHNMQGGTVYPREVTEEICREAHAAGLPVHLDGARIFNAAEALDCGVAELTRPFDSVMFCLSKGLGAPVGSMLVGSSDFIEKARATRKLLGGGMRQAGVLAAAGLIALEEGPKQIASDHENARYLAAQLATIDRVAIDPTRVVTNILIFELRGAKRSPQGPASEFCRALAQHGLLCNPASQTAIRMVTHRDVDRAAIERAISIIRETLATPAV